MKELSAENVNLKRLYEEETSCSEPVLIIVSPGTDPSQELEALAEDTIGSDRYHQVSGFVGFCYVSMDSQIRVQIPSFPSMLIKHC